MIEKWIQDWNRKISDWGSDPAKAFESDLFTQIYKGKDGCGLVAEALPEPYLGDPHNCSAVILNINPGGVNPEQIWPDGYFISKLNAINDYQTFAKQFPYLSESYNGPGSVWWKQRNSWILDLLNMTGRMSSDQIRPFALEVCPWHSSRWSGLKLKDKDLINHISNNVLSIAECAAKKSRLKFIVSVGKIYIDLFEKLGFEKVLDVTPSNFTERELTYPINPKGQPRKRWFSVWKSMRGGLYLNTWSEGSNKHPSKEFNSVQEFIVKEMTCNK